MVDQMWRSLVQQDPQVSQESIGARLAMIYYELNRSWSTMDLAIARPYVSDGLFDYLRYWIEAYHRQGLRNVLENMRCYHWAYARITRDAYYDAITVRVWATGRDYTIDAKSGTVVGGHKNQDRDYTEYWTLIRRAGARGPARSDKQCPNCGAELAITMGGQCEHCNVHVTAGEFDWVLSKIEQDDSYRG
jgi:predicted lipid-binding transport protein (Tim44 family)